MIDIAIKVFIICSLCIAGEFNEHDIEGIWKIPEEIDGNSSIGEIFIKNNKAYAYAFKYVFDNGYVLIDRDIKNENSDAKKLINTVFLYDLEFDGEKWVNGKIYNPNDKSTYNVTATLEDNGLVLSLRVSYDIFGLIGKTLKWNRLNKSAYITPKIEDVRIIKSL